MLFSVGCSENLPGSLGEDVLPPGDTLGIVNTDTFSIVLESRVVDEVQTGAAPLGIFGNYVDPEMGRISATLFQRLRLPGVEVEFGEALEFQKLELHLRLVTYYGSVQPPQNLEVYELAGTMPDNTDSLTSATPPPARKPLNLAEGFVIDYSDDGLVGDVIATLDSSLGKRLLFAPTDSLFDDEIFQQFFKGLAITTSPVGFRTTREPGAIFYADLLSQGSFLELSYSRFDPSTNERVDETFNFRFEGPSDGYHTIQRGEFENVRLLGFPGVEEDDMYEFIQAGAYVKTFLDVPAIGDLPQVAVNRALLTLKLDTEFLGGGGRFAPPANILAFVAGPDGQEERDDEGRTTLYGRFPYSSSEEGYLIDLGGHVQQVVSGRRENHGFILIPEDSAYTLNRAILGGVNHPTRKPVLRMTYTTLPD